MTRNLLQAIPLDISSSQKIVSWNLMFFNTVDGWTAKNLITPSIDISVSRKQQVCFRQGNKFSYDSVLFPDNFVQKL